MIIGRNKDILWW